MHMTSTLLCLLQFIGFSHNIISGSHDNTARIWDGYNGTCLHVLKGHTGHVNAVRVNEEGTFSVTCSDDNTARLWDTETGRCTRYVGAVGTMSNSRTSSSRMGVAFCPCRFRQQKDQLSAGMLVA